MCVLGLALGLLACGPGAGSATGSAAAAVPFSDEGVTQQSGYGGRAPTLEIRQSGPRWLVTAYLGQKNTGGHAIRVEQATARGTELRLQARVDQPAPGAVVTQVLTSPAHTIAIAYRPDAIVLVDQAGVELARTTP